MMSGATAEVGAGISPLVSVVVPCYNGERFLKETLECALSHKQDVDLEVIVVDDGSSDGTAAIAQSFGDRLRYIYQENKGLAGARNTGIDAAKGKYFCFLDDDDLLPEGALKTMIERFEADSENLGAVTGRGNLINENGDRIRVGSGYWKDGGEVKISDLLMNNRLWITSLIDADILRGIGSFDPALRSCEDRDMWLRLAAKYRIVQTADLTLLRRLHGNNLSANFELGYRSTKRVLKASFARRDVPLWRVDLRLRSFSMLEAQGARMATDAGENGACISMVAKSLLMWPVFFDTRKLGKPLFFRVRLLRVALLRAMGKK